MNFPWNRVAGLIEALPGVLDAPHFLDMLGYTGALHTSPILEGVTYIISI